MRPLRYYGPVLKDGHAWCVEAIFENEKAAKAWLSQQKVSDDVDAELEEYDEGVKRTIARGRPIEERQKANDRNVRQ